MTPEGEQIAAANAAAWTAATTSNPPRRINRDPDRDRFERMPVCLDCGVEVRRCLCVRVPRTG